MKKILIVSVALAVLAYGSGAMAAAPPVLTNNASPNTPSLLITIAAGGTVSIAATAACPSGTCPYDGSDDTYVGVLNNSNAVVNSVNLSSNSLPIFGFEGDGISGYGGGSNASDTTGYGGGDAFFTNISSNTRNGTVNFIGGIAASGGQGYFSLEDSVSVSTFTGNGGGITAGGGVPEPASWAMMLMGFFGLGSLLRRHRQGAAALA